jgi:hypothetical protein
MNWLTDFCFFADDKQLLFPLDDEKMIRQFLRPCKYYPESAYEKVSGPEISVNLVCNVRRLCLSETSTNESTLRHNPEQCHHADRHEWQLPVTLLSLCCCCRCLRVWYWQWLFIYFLFSCSLWDFKFSRIRDPWWWRQYTPLKRRSTIILHGSITQKTALNIIVVVYLTTLLR